MLDINKQTMKYSLSEGRVPIYETDDDGNVKYYEDEEGNKVPFETGDYANAYSEPVVFRANIAFSGGEAQDNAYGFDNGDYDAVILTEHKECPLSKGCLIWLDNDVTRTSEGYPDSTSADFIVIGVKNALQSSKYMLRAVTK